MTLWPRPSGETPALDLDTITREVERFARGRLLPWEAGYLDYHRRRYQDTLRLLPPGDGRRLLDVGSFPGDLSALAQARGWEVTGLNNDIEGAEVWTAFLEHCRERKIEILACEVREYTANELTYSSPFRARTSMTSGSTRSTTPTDGPHPDPLRPPTGHHLRRSAPGPARPRARLSRRPRARSRRQAPLARLIGSPIAGAGSRRPVASASGRPSSSCTIGSTEVIRLMPERMTESRGGNADLFDWDAMSTSPSSRTTAAG
jgi:hypothetical protein